MTENFPQNSVRLQTTDPGSSENKIYAKQTHSWPYHFQTTQENKEKLARSQKEKIPYLWKTKDKRRMKYFVLRQTPHF